MTNLELEQEKLAIDLITGNMMSLNFLRNATTAIFDLNVPSISVRELFDKEAMSKSKGAIPYSFGAIFGNLYCGILLAKENWYDLLPNDELPLSDPSWHLSDVTCTSPRKSNPTVKYVMKRIRNALGHGDFIIKNVPEYRKEGEDKHKFEKETTIVFCDQNQRDSSDTFRIELSLYKLLKIVKKFQAIAHIYVTSKI